jgi:hypothetical protein
MQFVQQASIVLMVPLCQPLCVLLDMHVLQAVQFHMLVDLVIIKQMVDNQHVRIVQLAIIVQKWQILNQLSVL